MHVFQVSDTPSNKTMARKVGRSFFKLDVVINSENTVAACNIAVYTKMKYEISRCSIRFERGLKALNR